MHENRVEKSKSTAKLRIVIAGGGTGGHLYPGLALADTFRAIRPETEIVFIGTKQGLEARVVPESGYQLVFIPVRGLLRKITLQNLLFPFRLAISILKCLRFFRQFRPHLMIGTGGFTSGPALMAAKIMRIPRVIEEQNSYPGVANRRVGQKVDAVFLTFENAKKYFTGQKNIFVYGNPIRSALGGFSRRESCRYFGLDERKKTVLIFGGSQGAKRLNEIVHDALSDLLKLQSVQVIWIVGPSWFEHWKNSKIAAAKNLKILPYVEAMGKAFAVTDLAVCRAGATTISELVTCGIPAIYVPFPFATGDHQTANAKAVVEVGGGELIHQKELTAEVLLERLKPLILDDTKLGEMSRAAKKLSMQDAAERIAKKCLEIVQEEE
jgi:UDP-N-acetylglucosamine--N-acetylmuramyl-(pentapeptide) pyrophosphoryl-undecaprenol N-acetylglucosamine transferase